MPSPSASAGGRGDKRARMESIAPVRGDGPSGRRPSGIHAGVTSTGSTWLRQSAGVRAYLARMAAEMDRDQFLSLRRMRARWARSVGLSRPKTRSASVPRAARIASRTLAPCSVSSTRVARRSPGSGRRWTRPRDSRASTTSVVERARDVQMIRQLGQAQRPVVAEHAQRPQLGRGDVPRGQALVGRLAQLARDRPEGVRQRLVAGRVAPAGPVPRSWWSPEYDTSLWRC